MSRLTQREFDAPAARAVGEGGARRTPRNQMSVYPIVLGGLWLLSR